MVALRKPPTNRRFNLQFRHNHPATAYLKLLVLVHMTIIQEIWYTAPMEEIEIKFLDRESQNSPLLTQSHNLIRQQNPQVVEHIPSH